MEVITLKPGLFLHLKRRVETGDIRQDYALLVEPNLSGRVKSDNELYFMIGCLKGLEADITGQEPQVTIAIKDAIYAPSGPDSLRTMSAKEFMETWKGD